MEIKINKILEDIIPKLKADEYEKLKESIGKKGLLQPLDLMEDGTIVDGHHRFKICVELGFNETKIPYMILPNIKTIEDAIAYSFDINFARRHLTAGEKAEWGIKVLRVTEKPNAQDRRKSSMSSESRSDDSSERQSEDLGSANEKVAEKVGVSRQTVDAMVTVMEKASNKVKDEVRAGERGVKDTADALTNLDEITDSQKKKEYKNAFEKKAIATSELKGIVETGKKIDILIESAATPEIQEAVRKKFKDRLWTKDLKLSEVDHEIRVREGTTVVLEAREIETAFFNNKKEADDLAKACGGYLAGEKTYYVLMIDPLKYDKKEIEEKFKKKEK